MSIQATAIYRRSSHSVGMPGGGAFGFHEVVADDKVTAIARAEKVAKRLGEGFAVAWDLTEMPEGETGVRWVKLLATGQEMPWDDFVAAHGAEIGLL
jgi:hypothetical protein